MDKYPLIIVLYSKMILNCKFKGVECFLLRLKDYFIYNFEGY